MVYAAINWVGDAGEDIDHLQLQVLSVLTDAGCDRQFSPFQDDRYILARLPSKSKLDAITIGLSLLPLTFIATICPSGEPFGCSPAPRIDRARCMAVTG